MHSLPKQILDNRIKCEREEHRNVFVIMRYAKEQPLSAVEKTIKETLSPYGLNAILARDHSFDEELWGNVKFCMDHSWYAIAVFESLIQPEHNPNVALELGYMFAQRKQCLILKERSLPTLPADIIGRLYTPFDLHKPEETISSAIKDWLRKLGHSPCPGEHHITGDTPIEANKERTRLILEGLHGKRRILRQAAALSSLAISDNETQDDDLDGSYHAQLLVERHRIAHLLHEGCKVRVLISPDALVERVELKLVTRSYVEHNILPRFQQLMDFIALNIEETKLQVAYTLRLPHDNLLVMDEDVAFIGRKRRKERGFPHTVRINDATIVQDEIEEFDYAFSDNVAALLHLDLITDEHYGSVALKYTVLEKLRRTKRYIKALIAREQK